VAAGAGEAGGQKKRDYSIIDHIKEVITNALEKPGRLAGWGSSTTGRNKPAAEGTRNGADAGDQLEYREEDVGRAFGHPAADRTPAATHVINFLEDNPALAWGSSEFGGPNGRGLGRGRLLQHDSGKAAEPEAGTEGSRGAPAGNVPDGSSAAAAAAVAAKKPGESLPGEAAGPLKPVPAVLPDVVGAGGFAEFVPLLEAVIGR